MKEIFSTRFGSDLYGTATPQSDIDYKVVFIPKADDILLGRVKGSFNRNDKQDDRSGQQRRNHAGEVDIEYHSLDKFLSMAADGQTVALDMLFATPLLIDGKKTIEGSISTTWMHVWENRHRLLSRRSQAFIGYCRQQANKYGIKGSRMAAAEKVAAFFERQVSEKGAQAKTIEALDDWSREMAMPGTEFTNIVEAQEAKGQQAAIRAYECCGRKVLFTVSMKEAAEIFGRLFDQYGERARKAKKNEGVDWKALSHAVRVGHQAVELLSTGHITFPRPEAVTLYQIKMGHVPYDRVAGMIEDLLLVVEQEAARSILPEEADHAWIDGFVSLRYRDAVINGEASWRDVVGEYLAGQGKHVGISRA